MQIKSKICKAVKPVGPWSGREDLKAHLTERSPYRKKNAFGNAWSLKNSTTQNTPRLLSTGKTETKFQAWVWRCITWMTCKQKFTSTTGNSSLLCLPESKQHLCSFRFYSWRSLPSTNCCSSIYQAVIHYPSLQNLLNAERSLGSLLLLFLLMVIFVIFTINRTKACNFNRKHDGDRYISNFFSFHFVWVWVWEGWVVFFLLLLL